MFFNIQVNRKALGTMGITKTHKLMNTASAVVISDTSFLTVLCLVVAHK